MQHLFLCLATLLLGGCLADGSARFSEDDEEPVVYQYRTEDGRLGFAQSPELVPAEARRHAEPLDLSAVSLNTELGNELAARVTEEHARLAESDGCRRARDVADQNTVERLSLEHRGTLVVLALLFILVIATPWAARRFGAPAWGRVLSFALPALALLAFTVFAVTEARRELARIRGVAALCDPDSFATAPVEERVATLRRLDALLAREGAVMTRE